MTPLERYAQLPDRYEENGLVMYKLPYDPDNDMYEWVRADCLEYVARADEELRIKIAARAAATATTTDP